jgi:parallel beta-helix repeat protein
MPKLPFLPQMIILIILFTSSCSTTAPPATAIVEPAHSPSPAVSSPPAGDTPTAGNTIYHVSPDGNDNNDGSVDAPWATIQHAVDTILPGDTIWVHQGSYAGARIEQSGQEDAWMTLMAAPGENPVLDRPGSNNRHDSILELETWSGSGTVNYWIIAGLEVTGADGWGIDMRGNENAHSHHLVVRGNRVHDNGWAGGKTGIFTAFVDDVLVENNHSYHNGEHGIYLSNSGDRPVVRGNSLYENAACGLHMNGDISLGGDGTIADGLVENNIIYENGTAGCAGINMDGVTHTIVRNNLLYQNHASGIALFRYSGAVCAHDNHILHNTVIQAADARWALVMVDFMGDGSGCANNRLLNNIFYNYHDWRGIYELQRPDFPGLESDHNVVMDRFSIDEGNSVISLADWQDLGFDQHSIMATPADMFVDVQNHDYHLRAGSPVIDLGQLLPQVPFDFEGDPRPAGPSPDSGVDEWLENPVSLFPAGYLPILTLPDEFVLLKFPQDRAHINR